MSSRRSRCLVKRWLRGEVGAGARGRAFAGGLVDRCRGLRGCRAGILRSRRRLEVERSLLCGTSEERGGVFHVGSGELGACWAGVARLTCEALCARGRDDDHEDSRLHMTTKDQLKTQCATMQDDIRRRNVW